MKIADKVKCGGYPCTDIKADSFLLPYTDINPETVQVIMIAETPPENRDDYFYANGRPAFIGTTLQAFNDAGIQAASMDDILKLGVYITTAVKCAKTEYAISRGTITNCSMLLEKELDFFPNVKVIMLMGDVAIKALNIIAKRKTGENIIPPSGSTYKIRKQAFYYGKIRVFPSYLMTGKNYLIEKSKRGMIAEDIKKAVGIIN